MANRRPLRSRSRQGILVYVVLGLAAALATAASVIFFLGGEVVIQAKVVYHSEVITTYAEAAVEEVFLNIEDKLNDPQGNNKLFDELRKPWDPTADNEPIELDKDTMIEFCNSARLAAKENHGIEGQDFIVEGRITQLEPFQIRGMNPLDPIEKNGALEVKVTITIQDLTKVVVASKPIKVVRTTMPVLSESTLFVNNLAANTYDHWESAAGYDPANYPEPSKTLSLDHGWVKYSKTHKKDEFKKLFIEKVLPEGAVPPGRVFMREAIVPLTNGNRAAGALQKTFYSAESELLPNFPAIPLEKLREGLREDYLRGQERQGQADAARQLEEGIPLSESSTGGTTNTSSAGPSDQSTNVPEEGELIIRYLGAGRELVEDDLKDYFGGKESAGYRTYFSALADGPWGDNPPTKSGLDLFGRTTDKKDQPEEEEEGGIWNWIKNNVKKITAKFLNKLYAKYDIKLSPTLVYGNVLQAYYMARDYAFTGWLENVSRTFSDKQIPLPYFPKDHLDALPQETPMEITSLPQAWSEDMREKFMKLPDDIRKPSFIKTLDDWAMGMNQQLLPLLPESLQEKVVTAPEGTILSPYHTALRTYLQTDPESPIDQWMSAYMQLGQATEGAPGAGVFLSNVVDRANDQLTGAYEHSFELPLTDFNPFLFYVKATEYIASLIDPRMPEDAPADQKHVFLRKYRDKDDPNLLNLNGVIYITGTEDLHIKNFRYRGKALIITFGRVIFDGFFVKKNHDENDPKKNDLLTIISLGGIAFRTSNSVEAQLYSYIYPFAVEPGEKMRLFGGMGCNDLMLERLGDGGEVNFDWTYHIPPDKLREADLDALPYYHVAITEEINKYEYLIRRDHSQISPGGAAESGDGL